MFDLNYLMNEAKSFLAMNTTGVIDFKESDFLRCLVGKTLPRFSVYVPYYYTHTIDPRADGVKGRPGCYFIMNPPSTIIGVNKMISPDMMGGFGDYQYTSSHGGSISGLVSEQMRMDAYSAMAVTSTGRFHAPNIYEIFPKEMAETHIIIELKLVHPSSCHTVPAGAFRRLADLFRSDLSRDILGNREFFSSLSTMNGTIELNLDRIRTMAERNDDILQQLEENMLRNSHARKLYIG